MTNIIRRFVVCLLVGLLGLCATRLHAQLAITEAMSSASTNNGPELVTQNSDFWELTNFGTNRIDLTGYRFDDSDNNLIAADSTPFQGLVIEAGESILFVQNNVNTNAESVRAWWGTNLAANVKIQFYSGNGFSSSGDGIRLWGPNATSAADVIDSVDFGEAIRGSTFTYDRVTGEFGVVSTNGVNGAAKAGTTDDIGSPGRTAGPAPLKVIQQPADLVVNPGDTAVFTIKVQGRPRGKIQWYFKDAIIPDATGATLQIPNAQASSSGFYHAVINNGVQSVTTAKAQLALESEASAPIITASPADLTMTAGQSFTFHAQATGVPQPVFEWRQNGTIIPDITGAELTLSGASEQQSGIYSVIARNAIGAATNTFQVTVTPPPRLVITEVMSSSSTNATGHGDWWELSNLGTFSVSLKGYRFDDNSETLGAAFTITNNVTIAPGESVIFTEDMSPEAFTEWWGAENLPANLKIITYHGNGLSSGGDAVNLWNAAATEDFDKVASVVFSTATAGFTFIYNPDTALFGELSVAGKFGAVAAVSGGDIGSPGYVNTFNGPKPARITRISRLSNSVQLNWTTQAGRTYLLQSAADLQSAWATEKTVTATGASASEEIPAAPSVAQRFYRIITQ